MVSAVLESALLRTWSNAVLLSATPASCVTLQPPCLQFPELVQLCALVPSPSRRGSCLEGTFLVPLVAGLLLNTVLKCWFSLLLPLDYSVHKSYHRICHVCFLFSDRLSPFDCEGRICSLLNIFTNSTFIQQKFWHILGTVNKEAKVPDFTKLTFLVGKNRQT